MEQFQNPYRLNGSLPDGLATIPDPSIDAAAPLAMLARCPSYSKTPLRVVEGLIPATLWVKDERERMGLGSFKALGGRLCDRPRRDGQGGVTSKPRSPVKSMRPPAQAITASQSRLARNFLAHARSSFSVCMSPEGFAERLRAMGG